jgi:hypothetical protein
MLSRLLAAVSAAVLLVLLVPGPAAHLNDSCAHATSQIQNHCGGGKK